MSGEPWLTRWTWRGVPDQHGSQPDNRSHLAFLHRQSVWARGIPCDVGVRTLDASFARVVTGYGQFAYLSDVYVLPKLCGRGLGRALVAAVLAHPARASRERVRSWRGLPNVCATLPASRRHSRWPD